ncbi:hypothetical protein GCM10009687_46440 [Asanoa iriomotensis]|uniref:TadE-like domain-containing protein n=1 Tax=Asanoa iriomotensis TaxID=234613 RepID=A0ABQ4BXP4_9ACTN|nr:hypothetical protein Air01nite_14120 [Asanoa iriomotensis]
MAPSRPRRSAGAAFGGKRDRGAAAVEAAFVFPILLLIVFGIIDFGRMLNAQMNVTEAAQQGARIASFGDRPDDRVRELAGDDARVSAIRVCEVAGSAGGDARVTVTASFEFVTPVGVLAAMVSGGGSSRGDVTLASSGVMPCS